MLRCHPRQAYLRSQLTLPLQGTGPGVNDPDRQPVMVDAEAGFGSEAQTAANDISFPAAWPIPRPKMARAFPGAA